MTTARPSSTDAGSRSRPRVAILAGEALFASFFPASVLARLESFAAWERPLVASRLGEVLARADALITTWQSPFLSSAMLAETPVRMIAHCGGELRQRMEEAILDAVTVVHTPGPMARPAAEMALAMTLAVVRRLPHYEREMRWGAVPRQDDAREGETLEGRRVGIVGLGRIGREVARLLAPFGAERVAADPWVAAEEAAAIGLTLLGLDELLASSPVVVLTAALTPETRGMLDARRLGLLRDGAVLVNVARGGLVDLDALVAELASGRIRAALDVTDPLEPLPAGHVLRRLPNVLLTPHVAGGGLEVRRAIGEAAVDELARFFRGEPPGNVVTRPVWARMT